MKPLKLPPAFWQQLGHHVALTVSIAPFFFAIIGAVLSCFILTPGILFGLLMISFQTDTLLHTAPNQNQTIQALVISDGCGSTCGCTIRVDVRIDSDYYRNVWRGRDACTADIQWISPTVFIIIDDNHQRTRIDTAPIRVKMEQRIYLLT